ncbi:hypothetical protein AMS68_002157 [Peltaster fructicola]|uniref:DUF202 domain-containing protein n=1 Tax=Peltaster fructicola TaxID=286661 RepID=A0A6H0XQ86_9PEZI|nr:hypothetical protein AMS68_002157 [Peltaster fructicola]
MFRRLLSEPIKNTGSVARDLLAAERTFLAWARTGLGFIALGIALEKVEAFAAISPTLFHLENSRTRIAAGVLVGSGSVCVLHGMNRYFTTLTDIKDGLFRPNKAGVVGLASVCVGIAVAGAALVVQNDGGRVRAKLEQEEQRT